MKWLHKYGKVIVTFAGPIVFEIANELSGSWFDENKRPSIGIGKFITILIGITYFILLSYYTYKEYKSVEDVESLNKQIDKLQKKCDAYKENTKSLCDILGYTTEKTRQQIDDFKKTKIVQTYYLNTTNAATIVCKGLYDNILRISGQNSEISVNYYIRYKENGKVYSEMIAREGYNSNPKFYHIKKLYKKKKDCYFCERLLNDDNPDVVFLPSKSAIRGKLKISGINCKYNQYVGVPICRMGCSEKVALIEIVAHNDCTVWKSEDEVREFIQKYCNPFKDYFLMIDMLSNLYETINACNGGQRKEVFYAENSEVSNCKNQK